LVSKVEVVNMAYRFRRKSCKKNILHLEILCKVIFAPSIKRMFLIYCSTTTTTVFFSQASWGRLEMKPERNKFKVQAH